MTGNLLVQEAQALYSAAVCPYVVSRRSLEPCSWCNHAFLPFLARIQDLRGATASIEKSVTAFL